MSLDSIQDVEGVVQDPLLTQQDYVFSFSELRIPFSFIQNSFQIVSVLYTINHYCDDLSIVFDGKWWSAMWRIVNDTLLAPWNELIHHLSQYNLHMHTFIRDTPLNAFSSPVSPTINRDTLVGLMHQLSASLQGASAGDTIDTESPRPTEPLLLLKSMCDSINSQLNSTMTIKDANVQSDVESLRWWSQKVW